MSSFYISNPPVPTQALATLLCSLLCPDASGGPGEARLKPKVKGRPRKHFLFHMKPALSLSHVPTRMNVLEPGVGN